MVVLGTMGNRNRGSGRPRGSGNTLTGPGLTLHPVSVLRTSAPAPARGGPFRPGDRVQLTDPKGRHYTVTLEEGGQYHTHRGGLAHNDLIGKPEGSVVVSAV